MSRILKILIIFLIVVALISGAVFVIARRQLRRSPPADPSALLDSVREQETSSPSSTPPPAATPIAAPRAAPPSVPALPADPAVQMKADLQRFAMLFIERWGAFSNQQGVSGAASLTSLMTASLQRFTAGEEARLRSAHPDPSVPYRIQTRALNAETISFSPENGTASFLVATQRVEVQGVASNRRTFSQEVEVRMVKEAGLWKVSGAYWKEQKR